MHKVKLNAARLLGAFLIMPSLVTYAELEEVIVTAQKRAENVQDVPIAITAASASMLEKTGISGSDELTQVVPNLQFSRQVGSATPFIRGVGTKNSSVGDESSVSTYVDGVYYSSMAGSVMDFNNIERVEVLRGPQGTLFGRNATGGLIHVITKDPTHETSGLLGLSYGSYGELRTDAYASTGLTDSVAIDLSAFYLNRDKGYGDNITRGEERPGEESSSLRSKLLFDIDDNSSLVLSALRANRRSDVGIARQAAVGTTATGGGTNTGDYQDINTNQEPLADTSTDSFSGKYRRDFEHFELISTTAKTRSELNYLLDQDSGPSEVVNFYIRQYTEQFSQEFQLNSTGDGALQWTAGLYYLNADAAYDDTVVATPSANIGVDSLQETTSYAAYAQGSYDISSATKATLGARYTKDKRELSGATTVGSNVAPFTADESWTSPSWRLALDHELKDNVLLYASYSRGFKSGVYNTLVVTGSAPEPVDPEELDAYEVGFKGDFLDRSLRVNASLFYYDFQNLQLQQILGGAVFLFNVGDSEMYGAEVETQYYVTDNFDINVAVALLETEYTNFDAGPVISPKSSGSGNEQNFADLAGNEMTRAPKFTSNISANYRQDTALGEVNYNVSYYYNDGFYWEPDNRTEQDSYDVLNAEVALTTKDEAWRFRLYARNMLDSEYSYYSQQSTFGDFVSAAPPATYGVAVRYSF